VFDTLLVRELKLNIPFFGINDSLVVLRKGLPRVIELEVFLPISITRKSTGT
jgi:hypothetical protein